jgi:hypothetical protein
MMRIFPLVSLSNVDITLFKKYPASSTYRSQFSHHLIEPNPEGYFTVNKTFYGPLRTLDEVGNDTLQWTKFLEYVTSNPDIQHLST